MWSFFQLDIVIPLAKKKTAWNKKKDRFELLKTETSSKTLQITPSFKNFYNSTPDVWMNSGVRPLSCLRGTLIEIIPREAIPEAKWSAIIYRLCALQKTRKAPFPPLVWVTAERHVSGDERRWVSLRCIWLTLSDSSVPGQFRHTDIKHIKCLSRQFPWHCSSTLICYPWRAGFLLLLHVRTVVSTE